MVIFQVLASMIGEKGSRLTVQSGRLPSNRECNRMFDFDPSRTAEIVDLPMVRTEIILALDGVIMPFDLCTIWVFHPFRVRNDGVYPLALL